MTEDVFDSMLLSAIARFPEVVQEKLAECEVVCMRNSDELDKEVNKDMGLPEEFQIFAMHGKARMGRGPDRIWVFQDPIEYFYTRGHFKNASFITALYDILEHEFYHHLGWHHPVEDLL